VNVITTESSLGRVRDAFELMDKLERLHTDAELRDELLAFTRSCGLQFFTVTQLPQPCERVAPHMLLTVWPENWLKHYDRSGYYTHDPVVRQCGRTVDPFLWSSVQIDTDLQPKATRVMGEAFELGMQDGFCIPIIDVSGFQAVVSMAGPRFDLSPHEQRALHLVGYYAHAAATRISRRRRQRRASQELSVRERDVLSWLAVGRQASEVAELLGIGEATVATHIKRAKEKLGTRNTTHTVVEALRQHQIRP
jgi:LuxR family quorum sensing-dependent transcriptional regulator